MANTTRPVVHSDPEIMGGTPVFVGTRVPVQTLFDYLEGGDTLDEFLRQFPTVKREQATVPSDFVRGVRDSCCTDDPLRVGLIWRGAVTARVTRHFRRVGRSSLTGNSEHSAHR